MCPAVTVKVGRNITEYGYVPKKQEMRKTD